MKSEYLKNLIVQKDSSKVAYQSYLDRIQSLFSKLQQHPDNITLSKFETQLHAAKDHKQLKAKDKQPIFKYFVQRNVQDFHFLQESNNIELRLMKFTKTQLDNYQLDWKQLWERLLTKQPQLPSVKTYNELTDFLKVIRHLYSPDNSVQVIEYFLERHSLYTDNLSNYLSLFIHINPKTSTQVFTAYLDKIFQLYHLNQLKASDLLVMYLNASKYKQSEITPSVHQELNKIVLYSVSTPSSDKKDSIEGKFSTQTSNIVFRIIGKCNQYSLQLLKQILQMLKLFIRPFEDSKKPLKFLCLFIMGISKRIQTQEGYRTKIAKLKSKEEKRLNKIKKEEKRLQEVQSQESAVTMSQSENKPISDQKHPVQHEKQQDEDSEDNSDEEGESDDEDQENKVQNMIKMQSELQEPISQRHTSNQSKIQKLQSLLKNYITPQIKEVVKQFMTNHLQQIFYVNSKKMVSRILRQGFKLFPELIPKSLQILQKAGNIPTINEDGLIVNIRQISKHLFSSHLIENGIFLEHILKVLSRVKENRRITDVWDTLNSFVLKLPLLDQKDMELISDTDKELFQKKFNQKHDWFYQTYSQDVFDCIKRLFSESQYYDSNTPTSIDKNILDMLLNCYPYFKKRVLRQMQEQILENNNKFLLSIFHTGLRPSKSFETSLKGMIQNGNIETEENMSLNINVNVILSMEMQIGSIKKLIRGYSKRNNYRFLRQIMISLTNYNINYQPISSTLNYLNQKPELKINQEPSYKLVIDKIKHVYEYGMEVLDQISQQLSQFQQNPLKGADYIQLVTKLYTSKQNTFKNMKVQKRKTVGQLLQILKILFENLFHEYEEYNPETNTIQFKEAPYKRQSLLGNSKFISIINTLAYNQLFLHDPNIMNNLTGIIQNQVYFMYRHYIRLEKQILKKYTKKSKREQLAGEINPIYAANVAISKARIAHFSILYNQHKDQVSIDPIKEQLKVLMIAPSNQKSSFINKLLVKKSQKIQQQADRLITFLSFSFDSRFYYQKVFSLLSDFLSSGYKFTANQIIAIINSHIPLLQAQNIKIRDSSIKSLDKFFRTMRKRDLYGKVEESLRDFIKKQKLQLVWMIAVLIISKEGVRDTPVEEYLESIYEYLKGLEILIMSDTRIVRRIALFAYSFCFRRAKQAVKIIQNAECPDIKYSKPKSILELYESGFLREDHIGRRDIANKQMLKKSAPYTSYRTKRNCQSQTYEKIKQHAFNFILSSPETGMKILQQFHLDMAASVDQVISMMQNKKHDLAQIAIRNLQGCYIYAKLQKLHFDRFQHHFGESFYRYMLTKDAKVNGLGFFKATKGEVEKMLGNLEGYDNQNLIFIYLNDLIAAYQHAFKEVDKEMAAEVEKFILNVLTQMIYKGSGAIFKQLMMLISRCKQRQALSFIINFLESLIVNKEKVSRACQLLFTLSEDNYTLYTRIAKKIFSERIQINSNYISTLVNTIITIPQKYLLTNKQVQKFGVIDLKKEMQNGNLQKLFKLDIYLPSTREINEFLVQIIKEYVDAINQPVEGEEGTKEKNELIKATYSITTNLITTYSQFYETDASIEIILKLLDLLFSLLSSKMDLPIDYKSLEDTIKTLLSNKHDNIINFQKSLDCILGHVGKLPVKKQAEIIKIVANRPGNFHFVSPQYYERFIFKALGFQEHSMIYKETLISISTLLSYLPLSLPKIQAIVKQVSKGQGLLLMQAYVMSTQDFGADMVDQILSSSSRERRNLFCKQMLHLRGKKEYLDNEERCIQWRKIKQYSNPYHYHA